MNKKQFIEIITNLQKQNEIDNMCHRAFCTLLPEDYVTGYNNHLLYSTIIKMLNDAVKDQFNWIDYYIYELDYGKNAKEFKVKSAKGNNIVLDTPSKLYDLIKDII